MHCKAKAHIFFSLNSVFLFTWQAILSRKLTTASQYCLSIGRSDSVLPVVPVTEPAAPVDPCLARLGSCGESTDAVLLIPAPPLLSTICIVHKDFAFRHSNFFSWILKRLRRKYSCILTLWEFREETDCKYIYTVWRGVFYTYWRYMSWIIDITLWRARVVTSGGWSCSSLIRWTSHFITTSAKSTANFRCSIVAWENKWGKLQLTG